MRKRVERAFRLLSPFNGGRLSPQRFQLLARVVKAGHWPQHHLFCFFDRDGDGAVRVFVSNWVAGVGFFRVKAIGKCYDETRKELK